MRIPQTAALAIAIALLPAAAPAAETCDAIVVTGHPSYPPVAWASGGRIVGAGTELVTRVAKAAGIATVESRDFGSWEKALDAARTGQADVVFGLYRNEDRKAWLDFLEPPFMVDPVAVVVAKGKAFAYAGWRDLEGKKGVTNQGESYGNAFDAFLASRLDVSRAPGVDGAFAVLLEGKADYLLIGLYPGRDVARRTGVAAKVEFLPSYVVSADMFVAISKRSRCAAVLKEAFAAALKKEVAADKVQELLDAADRAYVGR